MIIIIKILKNNNKDKVFDEDNNKNESENKQKSSHKNVGHNRIIEKQGNDISQLL